jgi:hypothetical protein
VELLIDRDHSSTAEDSEQLKEEPPTEKQKKRKRSSFTTKSSVAFDPEPSTPLDGSEQLTRKLDSRRISSYKGPSLETVGPTENSQQVWANIQKSEKRSISKRSSADVKRLGSTAQSGQQPLKQVSPRPTFPVEKAERDDAVDIQQDITESPPRYGQSSVKVEVTVFDKPTAQIPTTEEVRKIGERKLPILDGFLSKQDKISMLHIVSTLISISKKQR